MTSKPTPVKRYHDYLLQTVNDLNVFNRWFVSPLNLGGVPGEGGGSGVPLAGIIGQLIQSYVAYDTTEATSLDVPASGQSLVHNLNRIRYWLNLKSGNVVVLDEGVEIASGVRVLDFLGAPVTVTLTSGYTDRVNVTISGTGGGGGDVVMVSSDDTTPNYLENKVTAASSKITVTTANPGGNEERQVDFGAVNIDDLGDVVITSVGNDEILGYSGGWINRTIGEAAIAPAVHTHLEVDITNLDHDAVKIQGTNVSVISPSNHDILTYSAGGEWLPSGLGAAVDNYTTKVSSDDTTDAFLEAKIVAGTNVTVTVLNPGANETLEINSTASGGGGGSAIDAYDEGISIASGITSLDWAGNQVSATASGTAVTVTISGIMVDAPEFVGCRTYRTTDYTTISGNTGWQNIDWQAEVYDTDSMWTTGGGHIIPSDGYYHAYGQVTFSGGLPTTNAMQVGLFDGSFPIGMSYNGYYSSSDQIITFPIAADWLYSTSDNINLKLVNHQGTEAILMSGIENSFLCTHKILAVVADAEETPVCCNVYVTGYDNDPADDTWTELDWDAERYDTDTMYPGVDDNTIVINTAGYYNIVLNLMWHGLDETPFPIAQRIVLNDTNVLALTYDMSVDNNAARAEGCALLTSCDDELAVNDTITVDIWHNRGSTLSDAIRPGDGSSFITLHRIGPA